MNDNEINIIFKENLYGEYTTYNKDLAQKYKCKNSNYCGNELIYTQLISEEVINNINTNYQFKWINFFIWKNKSRFLSFFKIT